MGMQRGSYSARRNQMTFSIVIATFQPGFSLRQTLQSIFEQTYQNFEVVIQDNLSKDQETNQIFIEYRDKISLKREKDLGIYDAFNKALKRCTGDWIIFLGADDRLANPDVLGTIQLLAHEEASMILGKIHNTKITSKWIPEYFVSEMKRKIIWKNTIHQQGCFYNKSWIHQLGFSEEYKVLGDYELHLKGFIARVKVQHTSVLISQCDADGVSKLFTADLYDEELKIKKKILPAPYFWMNIPWIGLKKWLKAQ